MILLKIVERNQSAGVSYYSDDAPSATIQTTNLSIVGEGTADEIHKMAIAEMRRHKGQVKLLRLEGGVLNLQKEEWEERKNWTVHIQSGSPSVNGGWVEEEVKDVTESELLQYLDGLGYEYIYDE